MKNLVNRFIKEEDAALDMWITIVLFLLVTIAAYIILWKNWGRQALKQAVNVVNDNMGDIMSDANNAITPPAF